MQTVQHVVDALVAKGFEAGYSAVDRGLIPDAALRRAVRFLSRTRLREIERGSIAANHEDKMRFVECACPRRLRRADAAALRSRDIAIEARGHPRSALLTVQQAKANEQHYEVSTEFLQSCLGKRMKYSSCLFPPGQNVSLDEAEELMLDLYCKRAKLENGMDILDLGCGWGSLCLYLAEVRASDVAGADGSALSEIAHIRTLEQRDAKAAYRRDGQGEGLQEPSSQDRRRQDVRL